jgi:glutamate-ammonia-ligase adenylyltransferase
LLKEVLDMRRRLRQEKLKVNSHLFDLKQGRGGMVDIEFLVQYLVLRNAAGNPDLLHWTDNVRLIQTLIETRTIDEYSAHLLKHAYLVYRAMAHQLNLQEKPAVVPKKKFAELTRAVLDIWHHFTGDGRAV